MAIEENDIPDVIGCWGKRFDQKFVESRKLRVEALRALLGPLKEERRKLQAEINRLTFESVIAPSALSGTSPKFGGTSVEFGGDRVGAALSEAQARLTALEAQIVAPQSELDRLTRQFWVTKEQVKAKKYDLFASRYRQAGADTVYHEQPSVTLERLLRLEQVMVSEIGELKKLVNQ